MLLRMRKRIVRDQGGEVRKLSRFGLEEFFARGCVEEEIANGKRCSLRQARFLHAQNLSACDLDYRSTGLIRSTRLQQHAGDRGDGWQGLTAKAQSMNV